MKRYLHALLFLLLSKTLAHAQGVEQPKGNAASSHSKPSHLHDLQMNEKEVQKENPDGYGPLEKVKVVVLPSEGSLRGVKGTLSTRKVSLQDFRSAITDYDHYSEFMPLIKKSKIAKAHLSSKWVDLGLKVGFTEVNYQLKLDHKTEGTRFESSWVKVSGDLKEAKGSWVLESEGELLKVTYVSHVDSGFLVPGWLESYLTERSVPDLFESVLKRASKLAQKKKVALNPEPPSL